MKRKLLIALTSLSAVTLAGCEENDTNFPIYPEVLPEEENDILPPTPEEPEIPEIETPDEGFDSNEEFVEEVLASIKISEEVKDDFSLLTSYEDISLNWTSNSDSIVITDGIARVQQSIEDVLVTLTVEAILEELSIYKSYQVVVKKYDVIPPSYFSAIDVMSTIETNLINEKKYYKNVNGQSITLDDLGVVQSINNSTYVYEDYTFAIFDSSSWAVSFNHKAMFYQDKIKYSHNSDKVSEVTRDAYKNKYGIFADSPNFTGYVINEDTVLSSSLVSSSNNRNVFEYVLDNELSSYDMRVQMKEFGGLTSLPVFSSIKLTLTLDNEWNIVKLETHELYKTKKRIIFIIETPLEQKLTTTFSKFDEIELPDITNYL